MKVFFKEVEPFEIYDHQEKEDFFYALRDPKFTPDIYNLSYLAKGSFLSSAPGLIDDLCFWTFERET